VLVCGLDGLQWHNVRTRFRENLSAGSEVAKRPTDSMLGRNYASELRRQTGLLVIPQMIYECRDLWWNDNDRGKPKNSKKNLSQCHFVRHKSHVDILPFNVRILKLIDFTVNKCVCRNFPEKYTTQGCTAVGSRGFRASPLLNFWLSTRALCFWHRRCKLYRCYSSIKMSILIHYRYILKVKQSHYTPWKRLGEKRYSSYSFSTLALDGGEWSASRPGRALPPGKGPRVPIVQEAGWAPELVWTQRLEEKSFASAGDRTSIARSSSP
jgi:hypothetical protein